MSDVIVVSKREEQLSEEISQIYNSGDCKKAVEKSIEFLQEFPKSYIARYKYAVMCGDYSYVLELSADEKKRYREIGNNGIKALVEDEDFKKYPINFQFSIRNEYYWFFELHKEQYELGIERLVASEAGHYSASVGASMMALKQLEQGNVIQAEEWAHKSFMHFKKFEAYSPDWYNINYFGSQALACLGKYEEALICYKDMYRKQKGPENLIEVASFETMIERIKKLRNE